MFIEHRFHPQCSAKGYIITLCRVKNQIDFLVAPPYNCKVAIQVFGGRVIGDADVYVVVHLSIHIDSFV